MFQGWRPCFASKVCWVQFPSLPQKANIEKSMLENIQAQLNGKSYTWTVVDVGSNPTAQTKFFVKTKKYNPMKSYSRSPTRRGNSFKPCQV